jgi:DNA-binding MarR family transcriptional regulator
MPQQAEQPAAIGAPSLGPLPGYVGFNLRRAQVASFRHLERTAGSLNLTPGQFSLLTFLEANPGVSQKTVSQEFGVDTSTLTPVLDGLANRRLIRRGRADHDRRTYALSLTPSGARLLDQMRGRIEAQEMEMAAALSPSERENLLNMLERICLRLESAG